MSAARQINLRPFAIRNVLVVGIDRDLEAIVRDVLESGDWAITYTPNNAAVLTLLQRKSFDLILTSEKTSGAEDVELLRKIRGLRPHTRLIILTDESAPEDVITAMREGAFSYFSKPFSKDTLAVMIRNAVEQPWWRDGINVISATPEWIRVLAHCDLQTADRVLQFFDEIAELPNPEKAAVGMAFREMLLNAIEHGGKLDPDKSVEISYVRARHMVTCRISDPGEGFTLDEIPHSAIANPDENPIQHVGYREEKGMRPGGYGLLLAQKLVDELIYGQNGNEVILVKYLDLEPRIC